VTYFHIALLVFPVSVLSSLQCTSAPLSKSGELDTCRANFWMELSLLDISKQEFENAKDHLSIVLSCDPNFKNAYKYRGYVYYKLEQYSKAQQDLSLAILSASNDTTSYLLRGRINSRLGRFPEAIDDYSQVLRLDRSYIVARFERAKCYYTLGRFQDAISDLNIMMSRSVNSAEVFDLLGDCHYQLNEYKEAIFYFTKYLNHRGKDSSIELKRGVAFSNLYTKRKYQYADSARIDFNAYVLANPKRADGYTFLGLLSSKIGDSSSARKYYKRSFDIAPNDSATLFLAADSEVQFENYLRALTLLQKAKSIGYSFDANSYYNLGLSWWGAKRDTALAVASFESAERMDSSNYNFYRHQFELLFGSKLYFERQINGMKRLAKLYKIPKLIGEVYAAIAITELSKGDLVSAEKFAGEASQNSPTDPNPNLILGLLQIRKRKIRSAAEEFKLAISKKTDHVWGNVGLLLVSNLVHDQETTRNYINTIVANDKLIGEKLALFSRKGDLTNEGVNWCYKGLIDFIFDDVKEKVMNPVWKK